MRKQHKFNKQRICDVCGLSEIAINFFKWKVCTNKKVFCQTNQKKINEKLLRRITNTLEEYGMPKFKDMNPARDVLQLIKDAGYKNER